MHILLFIITLVTASLNLCAANKFEHLIQYETEDNSPSSICIWQDTGVIYFKSASLSKSNHDIHLMTDKIYHLCREAKHDQICEAEMLLAKIKQNVSSGRSLHHHTALICLAQAHSEFTHLPDQAIHYFSEALDQYQSSGAAIALAELRLFDNQHASLYYIQRAIKNGYQYDIPEKKRLKLLYLRKSHLKTIQEIIEFEKDPKNY